jgi:hypothetical protein
MRRRMLRVLVAAGFLVLGVGLWPSPAQASIVCKVQNYHWCTAYVCCSQSCVYCIDSVTGELVGDVTCSDAFCWDKYS